MQMYEYRIASIAQPGQSDAGNERVVVVVAYCESQAMAWAKRWNAPYAVPTHVISCRRVRLANGRLVYHEPEEPINDLR